MEKTDTQSQDFDDLVFMRRMEALIGEADLNRLFSIAHAEFRALDEHRAENIKPVRG
jgi:hypothetical protein